MKLRKMTSAGMMDCKKALEEAEGDFDKAIGIIREKGKLVAAKRADRETSEGAVKARVAGNKAILVCLGCETDFVSRNSDFQNLANAIADVAIANCPADIEGLKACKMADGYTVEEAVEAQTGKTGEKHVLAYYAFVEAPFVVEYIHTLNGKLPEDCPAEVIENEKKIAIEKTKEEQVQKAVDAALKKAGINPAHVDSEDHIESNTAKGWLTPEQADKAREIIKTVGAEKAANLPAAMIENIANGRVQKFLKENTLTEQEYQMADDKSTVAQALAAFDKDVKVVATKRFSLND